MGRRCTGAGCSRGPWSVSPPCGARTPPVLSPSPMATGILTTPCWSSPASARSAAFCPLPGPPLVGEHTYGLHRPGPARRGGPPPGPGLCPGGLGGLSGGVGELLAPGELPLQKRVARAAAYPLHHPGLHPLRAVRPAVPHAGHWGGLRRHRWGEVHRLLPVREKLPRPGEGRVHPRVPKLCRGFLRKAERA